MTVYITDNFNFFKHLNRFPDFACVTMTPYAFETVRKELSQKTFIPYCSNYYSASMWSKLVFASIPYSPNAEIPKLSDQDIVYVAIPKSDKYSLEPKDYYFWKIFIEYNWRG